jgi:hypothetical protein
MIKKARFKQMCKILNSQSKRELRDNFIIHAKFVSSTPDQPSRRHEEEG